MLQSEDRRQGCGDGGVGCGEQVGDRGGIGCVRVFGPRGGQKMSAPGSCGFASTDYGRRRCRPVSITCATCRIGVNTVGWAHNPEVAGSNPAPATRKQQVRGLIARDGGQALIFVAARWQQDPASRGGLGRAVTAANGILGD
jgi:hypothetical protein